MLHGVQQVFDRNADAQALALSRYFPNPWCLLLACQNRSWCPLAHGCRPSGSSLEKAYDRRDLGLTELAIEPAFDPLHSEPRFQDLAHRMGLPLGVR
jgi:hypothetical protein